MNKIILKHNNIIGVFKKEKYKVQGLIQKCRDQ